MEQNYGNKKYIPRAFVERRKVKDRRSFFKLLTSSPIERRRVKDTRSLFKLLTNSPVDRRRVKDRRLFHKTGIPNKPE